MVSIDGRYVPGWDSNTGNLQYLDMLEDRWIRVTDKGTWGTNDAFSLNPMFSPDGEWIVHTWFTHEGDRQLRLDRRDGSEHRVLLSPEGQWETKTVATPLDWSPDGRNVLAVVRKVDGDAGVDQLVLLPADGGEPRVVKEVALEGQVDFRMALTAGGSGMLAARFSPDGRWAAYQQYEAGTRKPDIHIVALDGSADRPLVTGNGHDRLLGWVAEGTAILFHSEREARPGIWRLAIRDGSPSGEPSFFRDDVWGMEPMGIGTRGVYYSLATEMPQVHTMDVDFEAGEILSAPSPIRDPGSGNVSVNPSWSPDGRQVAYVVWGSSGNQSEVHVRSLETGEVTPYVIEDSGVQKVAWGSDPFSLLLNGRHRALGEGIFRLDLRSGELAPVLVGEEAPSNLEDTFKRDGRTVAYPYGEDGRRVGYHVLDLETGRELTIERDGWSSIMGFPGGERYAVWTERGPRDGSPTEVTLSVVDADGSERTLWQGSVQGRFMQTMAITSDGRHVMVSVEDRLMIVDVDTSASRFLKTASGEDYRTPRGHYVIQPNGSRIAFGAGEMQAEIWVMEGIH